MRGGVLLAGRGTWLALIGWIFQENVDEVVPVDGAFDGHHSRGGHWIEMIAVVPLGGAVDVVAARFAHQHAFQNLVWNRFSKVWRFYRIVWFASVRLRESNFYETNKHVTS